MLKENNSAARLYKILLELKSMPRDLTMAKAWATIFQVNPEDGALLYSNLVRLNDTLTEIERDIRLQDVDPDIYLQHFPKIRALLTYPNLQAGINQHTALLGEEVLTTLQFCSEKLSKTAPEGSILPEDLSSILNEINGLNEQIESSDLNKQLKAILLDLVESMRQAIAEFRIRGPKGLRQELFYILERLQRALPLLQADKDTVAVRTLWDVLAKFDTITSLAVNAPTIIAGFQKVLQGTPLS
jgi:hypothetical protein